MVLKINVLMIDEIQNTEIQNPQKVLYCVTIPPTHCGIIFRMQFTLINIMFAQQLFDPYLLCTLHLHVMLTFLSIIFGSKESLNWDDSVLILRSCFHARNTD